MAKKKKGRKMVNASTKKKWLMKLFPGVDLNKGEICKSCYCDLPEWSSLSGIERCSYCGDPKYGNTIAPWQIPTSELKRLMKERVWR